jgi:hypothetical protein
VGWAAVAVWRSARSCGFDPVERLGKTQSAPAGASGFRRAHLPGRLARDISTISRSVGVSLHLDLHIARLAVNGVAGDAHFPSRSPVARISTRRHRFTLTRLPVSSIPVPGNRSPEASWGGLGDLSPHHSSVAPVSRDPVASPPPPDCSSDHSRSPLSTVPRRPGLTRRLCSYLLGRRLLVAPVARSPVGGGR